MKKCNLAIEWVEQGKEQRDAICVFEVVLNDKKVIIW